MWASNLPSTSFGFGDDQQQFTLHLGVLDEFEQKVYARIAGTEQILLVSRSLLNYLDRAPAHWIDPRLLRGLKGPVERLRVTRDEGVTLDLVKSAGGWRIAAPIDAVANSTRVGQVVRSLEFARQEGVATANMGTDVLHSVGLPTKQEAEAGELRGATRVDLWASGQQPATVILSAGDENAPQSRVRAVRGDFAKLLETPREAFNLIFNTADFFRERQPLPAIRERASSLKFLQEGSSVLHIVRQRDGEWIFESPSERKGEAVEALRTEGRSPLLDLLFRIDKLEAVGFTDAPVRGPFTHEIHVTWDAGGRERLDRVSLGAPIQKDGQELIPVATTMRPLEGALFEPSILEFFDPFEVDRLRTLAPLVLENGFAGLDARIPESDIRVSETFLSGRVEGNRWVGDDSGGRLRTLGEDMRSVGMRGIRWVPPREGFEFPYGLTFLDPEGQVLADVSFRRPAEDEPPEALGVPGARARISGWDGVELILPGVWVERLAELGGPVVRR